MAIFYTDSGSFNDISVTGNTVLSGSVIISGSTQLSGGGLTGSFTGSHIGPLTGTASWASNAVSSSFATTASAATSITFTPTSASFATTASAATSITFTPASASFATTASFAVSASWAPGGAGSVTQVNTGDGLSGGPITSTGTISLNTASAHFISGSQQVTASRAVTASYADNFTGFINFPSGLDVTGSLVTTGSIRLTGSLFLSASDTTATNKVLVLNTTTGQVFTTASVGTGGGSGAGFPFNGDAVITGSLFVSGSSTRSGITGSNILALSRFFATPTAVDPGSPIYTFTGIDNGVSGSEFGMWLSTGSTNSALAIGYRGLDTAKPAYLNMFYNDLAALGRITIIADEIYPAANDGTSLGALNQNFSQAYITDVRTGNINTTFGGGGNLSITGSVTIDANVTQDIIFGTSDVNGYVETNIQNTNAGTNASTDVVATSNVGGEIGGFIDMGINSSTYTTANNIGGPNDAYLYMTSSNGEMYIGNASTGANSNIKFFGGGLDGDANTHMFISSSGRIGINVTASLGADLQVNGSISASSYTGSVFGGPLLNISEMSMLVSGTIAAPGGSTVTLNINNANYFAVSASGTGTVTWVVTNPPPAGRSQTIVIEYVNGGAVTNSWFSGTKWPGGAAPTLTTGVNTDVLGFVSDDAGTNWRGVLLQRNSS